MTNATKAALEASLKKLLLKNASSRKCASLVRYETASGHIQAYVLIRCPRKKDPHK